jgi:hypothetical protein
MSTPRQFRAAGPMLIPSCTPNELGVLQQAVARHASTGKIKYVALYRTGKDQQDITVYAQAGDKLSPPRWREYLLTGSARLQNIVPAEHMRLAINASRQTHGFQEFGVSRHADLSAVMQPSPPAPEPVVPAKPADPAPKKRHIFEVCLEAFQRREQSHKNIDAAIARLTPDQRASLPAIEHMRAPKTKAALRILAATPAGEAPRDTAFRVGQERKAFWQKVDDAKKIAKDRQAERRQAASEASCDTRKHKKARLPDNIEPITNPFLIELMSNLL